MLIMENPEEILQMLERYTKFKPKVIPRELEDYLFFVAKTGDTVYRWPVIKYLFREKLILVIKNLHESSPSDLPQYPNVDPFNYDTMKNSLLERFESFHSAPFTIQRLAELITNPRKQYSRIDKFMRAIEKNILVVSTIEPGRKRSDSENNDSIDSVINGDSVAANADVNMETESIIDCCRSTKESTKDTIETDREYASATSDVHAWPHSYNFKTANKETNTCDDFTNSSSKSEIDVEDGETDTPVTSEEKSETTATSSDECDKTKMDKEKTDPESILSKLYQAKEGEYSVTLTPPWRTIRISSIETANKATNTVPSNTNIDKTIKDDATVADSALKEDEKKTLSDETGGNDDTNKDVTGDANIVDTDTEIDKKLDDDGHDDDGKTEAKKKKLSSDFDLRTCGDFIVCATTKGTEVVDDAAITKEIKSESSACDENKTKAKIIDSSLATTSQTGESESNDEPKELLEKVTKVIDEKIAPLEVAADCESEKVTTEVEAIAEEIIATEIIPIAKDEVNVDVVNVKVDDSLEKSEIVIDVNLVPAASNSLLDIYDEKKDEEKMDKEDDIEKSSIDMMEAAAIPIEVSDNNSVVMKLDRIVPMSEIFSAVKESPTIDKIIEIPSAIGSIRTLTTVTNVNEIFMENDGESSGDTMETTSSPVITVIEGLSSSLIQTEVKMSTEDEDESIIISATTATAEAITTIVSTNDNSGEMEVDDNVGVEPMDQ